MGIVKQISGWALISILFLGMTACGDSGPSAPPQTCLELKQTNDQAKQDGVYTLYEGGKSARPWDVYCYGMSTATPKEFLTVTETENFSQIGNGQFTAKTSYRRYRFDPKNLKIDPADSTFATNTDFDAFDVALPEGVAYLPAGWAEFQPTQANDGPAGRASVNLEGTNFAFDESILANSLEDFFCRVTSGSPAEDGTSDVQVSADLLSFTLEAINSNQANAPNGVSTRLVAACDDFGPIATDFGSGTWPVQYVGSGE